MPPFQISILDFQFQHHWPLNVISRQRHQWESVDHLAMYRRVGRRKMPLAKTVAIICSLEQRMNRG